MTSSSTSPPPLFTTLLDNASSHYRVRPTNFLVSLLVHALGISFVIWLAVWTASRIDVSPRIRQLIKNANSVSFSSENPSGHGGGGTQERLAASKGALPKMTLDDQLALPEAVPTNLDPKLPEPPSVMALSAVKLPQLGQLGDPLSAVQGPLSNGAGGGGGIGSGCSGGVGPSTGPGFGPYDHGNVFQPGLGGVTAPRPVYDPDPDYSESARKAKFQGDVILWLVVGPDGRPRNLRVQRSLGMGLDEKALEAVSQWRFQPATLNGQPVAVEINVEVSFRLY